MGKQLPTCAALILAALGLLGPASPAAASPPPPPPTLPAERSVALVLDLGILEADLGQRFTALVHERLDPILNDAGLRLVEPDRVAQQSLRIRVTAFDSDRRDYELQLRMSGGDAQLSLAPIQCEACSEARLVTLVADNVARLLARQAEAEARQRPQPKANPNPDPSDAPSAPPKRTLGALGYSGLGLLGVGLAASLTGAYLLNRGVETVGHGSGPYLDIRDSRPYGATFLGIGALVAGTGAALLVVDLRRPQAKRSGRKVALQVAPIYQGLQLRGRF